MRVRFASVVAVCWLSTSAAFSPAALAVDRDWCRKSTTPPLPLAERTRAVVHAPAADSRVTALLAQMRIPLVAQYADAQVVRVTRSELEALQQAEVAIRPEPEGDLVRYRGVYFLTRDGLSSPKGPLIPSEWVLQVGPSDTLMWLVQLVGPATTEWNTALSGAGVTTVDPSVPNHALLVRMTPEAAKTVAALPFVHWLSPIEPLHKMDPGLMGISCPLASTDLSVLTQLSRPKTVGERHLVQILLYSPNATAARAVSAEVESRKGQVQKNHSADAAVVALVPPKALPRLAALPDVMAIERYTPPLPLSSGVRVQD